MALELQSHELVAITTYELRVVFGCSGDRQIHRPGATRLELRDNADVEPFRKESATHSLTPQDERWRGKEGAGERVFPLR